MTTSETGLQMRSQIKRDGTLELTLEEVPTAEPAEDEVLVRIEAAPINPSDLGMMFGPADMSTARGGGTRERPVLTAEVPERFLGNVQGRLDRALPVGNEGAGTVVAAGASEAAQGLVGKTVAILGGAMYAQYRTARAQDCLVLPDDVSAAEGASCFVNPLTALGMLDTMRMEGHTALVHTAAASNLGQMLNRVCFEDGVDLVNIVRRREQETLLRELGAPYVCNSSDEDFRKQLTEALQATGATLAFDAVGGGRLASDILTCMEAAISANATEFSRYGSNVHKQVYLYGGLDRGPTELYRNYGMAWGIGGWLLPPFLERVGPQRAAELRERVAAGIKTTFASSYGREVSLAEAVSPDAVAEYGRQATGAKFLVNPQKGLQ